MICSACIQGGRHSKGMSHSRGGGADPLGSTSIYYPLVSLLSLSQAGVSHSPLSGALCHTHRGHTHFLRP